MSRSWIEVLIGYRRERLPAHIYLPFAAFIAAAAQVSRDAGPSRAASFAYAWLLALALIVQFRLWDDLADREDDRLAHPERTLVRATSLWPFRGAWLAASVFAVLLLTVRARFRATPDIVGYAILCGAYGAWYCGARRVVPLRTHPALSALSAHLVLLKYPVFTLVVAGGGWPAAEIGWLGAAAVYACVCVDELSTDPRLRAARAVLAIDMAGVILASALMLAKAKVPIALSVQAVVVVALVVALAFVFRRVRSVGVGRGRPAVFVLTALGIVNVIVGGAAPAPRASRCAPLAALVFWRISDSAPPTLTVGR